MKNPEYRNKLSRRAFGRLLAASAALTPAASPQRLPPADELRLATQRLERSAQGLAKFDLPLATEPSFVFRA